MPTYEFECPKCGEQFEDMFSINAIPDATPCPVCTHASRRVIRSVPLVSTWKMNLDPTEMNAEKEAADRELIGYTKRHRLQASKVLDRIVRKREEKEKRMKKEGWDYGDIATAAKGLSAAAGSEGEAAD